MSEKAIGFLQFRLAVLLTRLAQDDFAWPSKEDLEIKIASLTEQITAAERRKAAKVVELAKHSGVNPEIAADVAEVEVELERLKTAKEDVEAHKASADDLAK